MDYAKKAIDKVREIDARRVYLWEVQADDFDAYLAMPDTPRMSHGAIWPSLPHYKLTWNERTHKLSGCMWRGKGYKPGISAVATPRGCLTLK